jgi:hypothetical protein
VSYGFYARLEIISDVVSEKHVAEKFRYHIGNTDTTSVFSDTTSEILNTELFLTVWRLFLKSNDYGVMDKFCNFRVFVFDFKPNKKYDILKHQSLKASNRGTVIPNLV